jgi:hypothetical protein
MEKDYVEVTLTRGKSALISRVDAPMVKQYLWCATPAKSGLWYAVRGINVNGKDTTESMHRFILGIKNGDKSKVDHIDGNGLNNQRENIRIATSSLNNHRRHVVKSNSGFYGVSRHHHCKNKFAAYIVSNKKTKYLGLFDKAEDAGRAYDVAARELHGLDAMLNFPVWNINY